MRVSSKKTRVRGKIVSETIIQDDVLNRVGQMTRSLHDSLRGLGLDKLLVTAAADIPDARDRLDYVAKKSEEAAQRVLNATDAAIPLQEKIDTGASSLAAQWTTLLQNTQSDPQFSQLGQQTLLFLTAASANTTETKNHLMDIMMAQDFQDLTGQVIKKITELAQNIEQQLVQILIDYSTTEHVAHVSDEEGLLNGPQMNPEGRSDVVAGQEQVDDLLDSLGF